MRFWWKKAHFVTEYYKSIGAEKKTDDLFDDKLKAFLEKADDIDYESINNETCFPNDGVIMDAPIFEFLFIENNKFYTCRWQIGCETEEITKIKRRLY